MDSLSAARLSAACLSAARLSAAYLPCLCETTVLSYEDQCSRPSCSTQLTHTYKRTYTHKYTQKRIDTHTHKGV